MNLLVSSSKDGLLKVWDLEAQCCLATASDEFMSNINDFAIISELRIVITGSTDNTLRMFKVDFNTASNQIEVKFSGKVQK